jgi:hypothetical protein
MKRMEPYGPRSVRDEGVLEADGWRVKTYGLAYEGEAPPSSVVDAARTEARQALPRPATGGDRHGVGCLGAHEGRDGVLAFLSWWANQNELHHRSWTAPLEDPEDPAPVVVDGPIACVGYLAAIARERDAGVEHGLAPESGPDVDACVVDRLDGRV